MAFQRPPTHPHGQSVVCTGDGRGAAVQPLRRSRGQPGRRKTRNKAPSTRQRGGVPNVWRRCARSDGESHGMEAQGTGVVPPCLLFHYCCARPRLVSSAGADFLGQRRGGPKRLIRAKPGMGARGRLPNGFRRFPSRRPARSHASTTNDVPRPRIQRARSMLPASSGPRQGATLGGQERWKPTTPTEAKVGACGALPFPPETPGRRHILRPELPAPSSQPPLVSSSLRFPGGCLTHTGMAGPAARPPETRHATFLFLFFVFLMVPSLAVKPPGRDRWPAAPGAGAEAQGPSHEAPQGPEDPLPDRSSCVSGS